MEEERYDKFCFKCGVTINTENINEYEIVICDMCLTKLELVDGELLYLA